MKFAINEHHESISQFLLSNYMSTQWGQSLWSETHFINIIHEDIILMRDANGGGMCSTEYPSQLYTHSSQIP